MKTTFADDDEFNFEEYFSWMYEDDYAPDLYDQYEYMMDHQDDDDTL